MSSNPEETRRLALAEIARRELARRGASPGRKFAAGALGAVNRFAQGLTMNLGDEAGAAVAATVKSPFSDKTWGQVYNEVWTKEQENNALATQNTPALVRGAAGLAGGALGGYGMAKTGATLLRGATSIPSAIGRGAVEGALYGGVSGAGAGTTADERVSSGLKGAALGAVTGGALSGTAAAFLGKQRVPELDELITAKTAAYNAAEQSGVVINQQSAQAAVDQIKTKLADAGLDAMLHPDTTRALARVSDDVAAGPITFKQLDTMRQIISDAAGSSSPKDQRVGLIFRDSFDDFVNGLKQPDVTGPNPQFAIDSLNAARDLYRRVVNGERIQELLRRADLRASGQFTSAGYEHAIRTEFKSLAMNGGEMRRFTPFERTAIERVVRGGNTRANITNVFRAVGKFAPRGPVATTLSTALGVGGGYAVGGPAGATAGPAALMTIGEAGRQTATALTSRNARLVSELMRRGGPPLPLQLPPAVSGAVAGGAVAPPWQVQDDPQKRLAALLQQRNR